MKTLANKDEWDNFHKEAGDKVVAIDFTATWCGPCKMIGPEFERLAEKYSNICFAKVDVDENEDVAADQQISAMPTFKFYRNKEMIDEMVGASKEKLEQLVEKYAA